MSRRWHRREEGTSTLEVVGLLGVFLFIVTLLIQGGLALYAISATETAARQAARAASLGDNPGTAADAALPEWLSHTITTHPTRNRVEVATSVPTVVPGFTLGPITRRAEMP